MLIANVSSAVTMVLVIPTWRIPDRVGAYSLRWKGQFIPTLYPQQELYEDLCNKAIRRFRKLGIYRGAIFCQDGRSCFFGRDPEDSIYLRQLYREGRLEHCERTLTYPR